MPGGGQHRGMTAQRLADQDGLAEVQLLRAGMTMRELERKYNPGSCRSPCHGRVTISDLAWVSPASAGEGNAS